jgi:uncharacterized cupin superfamily protein
MKFSSSALVCVSLLLPVITFAAGAPAQAVPLKPTKISSADAAGPILNSSRAVKESSGPDGPSSEVVMLKSRDRKFTAGIYSAGPSDYAIDAYEEDEFMFFLEGSVKLTSADGSVLEVVAGEGAAIPKGWKGRWTTSGYRKYFVTYESGRRAK